MDLDNCTTQQPQSSLFSYRMTTKAKTLDGTAFRSSQSHNTSDLLLEGNDEYPMRSCTVACHRYETKLSTAIEHLMGHTLSSTPSMTREALGNVKYNDQKDTHLPRTAPKLQSLLTLPCLREALCFSNSSVTAGHTVTTPSSSRTGS